MPSIPQSLLWISLVVLWLFVLVPMLINKRDTVRRTSDVALATRVLNTSSRAARLIRRGKPAAGHRSDPDWQPAAEADDNAEEFDEDKTGPVVVTGRPSRVRSVAVVTGLAEENEPDYLDVDVVDDDSGALPVGRVVKSTEPKPEPVPEPRVQPEPVAEDDPQLAFHDDADEADNTGPEAADAVDDADDGTDDEYEYIEDTSGLEAEDEPATTAGPRVAASRPRSYESKTAAAVTARKYQFRKRVLLTMAALLVFSAAAAFLLSPSAWYLCGTVGAVTLLYLAYLRRQTRIEERLRRRRMQRMARSRLGVENTHDTDLDVTPARLRQPGAAVLEIDDEDPIFEHLDEVAFAREYSLPHAAGQ
ncbi:membrane protein [soil metagenome]